MFRLFISAALCLVCLPAGAQRLPPTWLAGDAAAVLATVQAFFDTMAAKDAEGARKVLAPMGRFNSVRNVDGKPTVRASTVEDYLRTLPAGKSAQRERMWNPEVRVRGDIASVWTPYDFWIDGKFSHCGVDAFNLVRSGGAWTIAGIIYTVETTGCEPSPLGPLTP